MKAVWKNGEKTWRIQHVLRKSLGTLAVSFLWPIYLHFICCRVDILGVGVYLKLFEEMPMVLAVCFPDLFPLSQGLLADHRLEIKSQSLTVNGKVLHLKMAFVYSQQCSPFEASFWQLYIPTITFLVREVKLA